MTVVFDVTATPDSTMSSLGIEIVTDDHLDNKLHGKYDASSSAGPDEWRSVTMTLSRSAFEGRSVTIRAYTDPMQCMALYSDTGVVLVDGQHYAIDFVRDEDRWQARRTHAFLMFAFPTMLSRPFLVKAEVEVFETDVETVLADSALIAFDLSSKCAVEARRMLVPFSQLRTPLNDQCFEKLQNSLRKWNSHCASSKDVQLWIHWKRP